MTTDKARKRAVRIRMQKTGERYAAARRHVIARSEDALGERPLPPRVAEPTMSEAAILKGTGRTWDEWFRLLDDWGATGRTHAETARYVNQELGVDGWWSQSVTVGYEWARGLRQRHEVAGSYQVSITRTIAATAEDVWLDFVEARRRDRWLERGTLRTRPKTGSPAKSARFDDADGHIVHIYLTAKDERSSVAVTVEGLEGPDEVEAQRGVWKARLADLAHRWTSAVAAGARRAS